MKSSVPRHRTGYPTTLRAPFEQDRSSTTYIPAPIDRASPRYKHTIPENFQKTGDIAGTIPMKIITPRKSCAIFVKFYLMYLIYNVHTVPYLNSCLNPWLGQNPEIRDDSLYSPLTGGHDGDIPADSVMIVVFPSDISVIIMTPEILMTRFIVWTVSKYLLFCDSRHTLHRRIWLNKLPRVYHQL